jgi:general secretion pathway protein L
VLAEFLTWWGQNLLSLVPEAVRARAAGRSEALLLDIVPPSSVTLFRRYGGEESKIASLAIDDGFAEAFARYLPQGLAGVRLLLRLPGEMVLERNVTLPLAAERELENVVGYDMERLTPFTAAEVFWGVSPMLRDKGRGKITALLSIVPRAAIEPVMARLAAIGVRPQALEIAASEGAAAPRQIRLDHDLAQAADGRWRRLGVPVAAALLVFALISPFLRQAVILHDFTAEEEALHPRLAEVTALRAKINGDGGGDAVAAENRRAGDALAALAALTEILPADSYLTDLTMRERKIEVTGLSKAAAKLIGVMSDDPRLRNPAFSAPVTRSEPLKRDEFTIHADWAP